jgi:hypothetical protein
MSRSLHTSQQKGKKNNSSSLDNKKFNIIVENYRMGKRILNTKSCVE